METPGMLAVLARTLARSDAHDPLPARLCRACVEILGADGGALTLSSTTAERVTVSTADGTSRQIEDLQEVLGEGPGHIAFTEDHPVVLEIDGRDESAFPMFVELARPITGHATVFAVPMRAGGRTIGVLTLLSARRTLAYGLHDAQFLADAVGAALVEDPGSAEAFSHPTWAERSVVHQATGMVTAQLGVPPEDALALLRAHAFAGSSGLGEVAREVVGRRLAFSRDAASEDGIVTDQGRGAEER